MPLSTQALYFQLGMNADDDGYCEHEMVMRMTNAQKDDLKVLEAKSFVFVFDEYVLVILDWKENNYIRSDRYTPSKYLEIFPITEDIRAGIPDVIPVVDTLDTQVRLGKVRLGKERTKKVSAFESECLKILETYNQVYGTNKKSYRAWINNYTKWREDYSFEEINCAINNMKSHPWIGKLSDPFSLESFLRTDKDWISQCKDLVKDSKELTEDELMNKFRTTTKFNFNKQS